MEFLNAFISLSNFMLIPALAYGSQLALGALGITLIYSILRFAHFAHGDTMALGTAAVIGGTFALQGAGISIAPLPTALLAIPLGVVAMVIYLLAADRLVYRYYRRVRAKPMIFVMASLGVMFVTNGITRLFMGVGETRFEDGARFVFSVRDFREFTGLAEGLALRNAQAITIITALVVMVALFWFLNRTRAGKIHACLFRQRGSGAFVRHQPRARGHDHLGHHRYFAGLGGHALRVGQGLSRLQLFPTAAADVCRRHSGRAGQPLGGDCGRLCRRHWRKWA